jgi:hypothetical protein
MKATPTPADILPPALARRVVVDPVTGCWLCRGTADRRGYIHFSINKVRYTAHRLAWTATSGPIPDGQFVLHHCDNPPCCNPTHLFRGSRGDNNRDRSRKGRSAHKLSPAQVLDLRAEYQAGVSMADLTTKYGIHRETVRDITKGQKWRYLTGGAVLVHPAAHLRCLTATQAQEIRERYALGGVMQADLAREYGCANSNISAVILGRSWKQVPV